MVYLNNVIISNNLKERDWFICIGMEGKDILSEKE